ncbi:MAG: MATE family efflux transporter, partial [Candidatus Woodwardiibium sp.]
INAAQRGIGNTKISMITNIAANLTNCVFNYFLINGIWFFPALGVRGAAYATLLGNVVSFVMSLYSVTAAKGYLHIRLRHCFHLRRGMLALLARIGGSAGVEQVFMRIGFFAYSKMVAELSTADLSTHIICMNVINLSFTVGDGLGVAASALVGQNLGAKRPDLAEVYGKAAQRFGFLLSALLVLAFSFGGSFLVSLFTTANDDAVAYIMEKGVVIMYLIALTSPAQISQVIFSGCLRGAGDTVFVAVSSLVSIALVRPLLTYLFCYPLGFAVIGAWISLVVDQYLRLLFCGARFAGGKWTKIEV